MRRAFVLLLVAGAACGSSPLRGGDGAAGATMAAGGSSGGGGASGRGGASGGSGVSGSGGDGRGDADAGPITDARANPAMQTDGRCVLNAFARDGVCMCQSGSPDVCEGQCVDLVNDDNHCGACGHACGPSSPCVAGVCSPAPETIATAPSGCGSLDLAATGDILYWADVGHGTITRRARGEDTPTVIATGEDGPRALAASGTSVFWVGGAGKQLRRGALGQPPVTVATSATEIRGLAVAENGATVYYSTGPDVLRVAATGGPAITVAQDVHSGNPAAIAVDGDRLAFVSDLTHIVYVATLVEGQVAACGKVVGDQFDMTSCRMLARGAPKFLEQISFVPGWLVWGFLTSVVRSELASTASPPANASVGSASGMVTGLAVTPTFAYFADSGYGPTAGTIYKARLAEGISQSRLARDQLEPRSVVVGSERVFWSSSSCAILATNL